jgi:two-component system, LytTR family, response regulator
MELIQAIIIDDEPLDRELLRRLIDSYCPHIAVVGEADEGDKALALMEQLQPEVVFLDIQMRGETGFDILERLSTNQRSKVVFTTGFDHYGIQAVKAGAFDYLLKPIDIGELEQLQQKLLQGMPAKPSPGFITVFNKGMQQMVYLNELVFLQAQGSYTKLVLQGGSSLMASKNLKQFQEELPPNQFMKVHRSAVVNVQFITGFKNQGNEGLLLLRGGHSLPVSRGYKTNLQQFLF